MFIFVGEKVILVQISLGLVVEKLGLRYVYTAQFKLFKGILTLILLSVNVLNCTQLNTLLIILGVEEFIWIIFRILILTNFYRITFNIIYFLFLCILIFSIFFNYFYLWVLLYGCCTFSIAKERANVWSEPNSWVFHLLLRRNLGQIDFAFFLANFLNPQFNIFLWASHNNCFVYLFPIFVLKKAFIS